MLICSNFHDFYDVARKSLGIDKFYVYNRETIVKKGDFELDRKTRSTWPYPEEFSYTKRGVKHKYIIDKVIVGFCGKLYPVFVVDKYIWDEKSAWIKKDSASVYSKEKLLAYIEKEKLRFENGSPVGYWSMRDFSIKSPEAIENFFEGSVFKALEVNFTKYKCPIFLYGRFIDGNRSEPKLILNPCLKEYRFFQVKDPVTTYQELYTYISGVLGIPDRPTIKLSDKEMAKKKGHDGKYSFKKPPGKRGKKKWR